MLVIAIIDGEGDVLENKGGVFLPPVILFPWPGVSEGRRRRKRIRKASEKKCEKGRRRAGSIPAAYQTAAPCVRKSIKRSLPHDARVIDRPMCGGAVEQDGNWRCCKRGHLTN